MELDYSLTSGLNAREMISERLVQEFFIFIIIQKVSIFDIKYYFLSVYTLHDIVLTSVLNGQFFNLT